MFHGFRVSGFQSFRVSSTPDQVTDAGVLRLELCLVQIHKSLTILESESVKKLALGLSSVTGGQKSETISRRLLFSSIRKVLRKKEKIV